MALSYINGASAGSRSGLGENAWRRMWKIWKTLGIGVETGRIDKRMEHSCLCVPTPRTPLKHLQSDPALSKLFLSRSPTSKAKWAHNLLRNERKKPRDQRGSKNTIHKDCIQWRERISSSLYAFIYMCELGPAFTTHMGQCYRCNLTLSPHITIFQ